MLKIISVFLLIAITIALEMLYHKIFRVTYFGFAPLFKELCVCVIISLVIMGTLMKPFLPKEKASHSSIETNSVQRQGVSPSSTANREAIVPGPAATTPSTPPPPSVPAIDPLEITAFATCYFVSSLEENQSDDSLVGGQITFTAEDGKFDNSLGRAVLTANIDCILWNKNNMILTKDTFSGPVVSLHEYNYSKYGGRYQASNYPENDSSIVIQVGSEPLYARYYDEQGTKCLEIYDGPSYSNYPGTLFTSDGENITYEELELRLENQDETLSEILDLYTTDWDGTYNFEGNEADGRKTLTIQRLNVTTIQFEIVHIYGDGHTEQIGPAEAYMNWGDDSRANYHAEDTGLTFFSVWNAENDTRAISVVQHLFASTEDNTGFQGLFLLQ